MESDFENRNKIRMKNPESFYNFPDFLLNYLYQELILKI